MAKLKIVFGIAALMLSCQAAMSQFVKFDDFSALVNTKWDIDAGTAGVVDLHASAGKDPSYINMYNQGTIAYRSAGEDPDYSYMKTGLINSGGDYSRYRVAFDFAYRIDYSNSWCEEVRIGNASDNIRILIFQDQKDVGGNRYFVYRTVDGVSESMYAVAPTTTLGDWYHYDVTVMDGTATVSRWNIGNYGTAALGHPDDYAGTPLDTVSFAFSYGMGGNELLFTSLNEDQFSFLDNVWMGGEAAVPSVCGDVGTHYFGADIDEDCYVDMADLAILANGWLSCSDPGNAACEAFWTY